MKYYAFPIIQGQSTGIALWPEAAPLADVLKQVEQKADCIAKQGYWKDDKGERLPVEFVGFVIVSEIEWELNEEGYL